MNEKELVAALAEPSEIVSNYSDYTDDYLERMAQIMPRIAPAELTKIGKGNSLFVPNRYLCCSLSSDFDGKLNLKEWKPGGMKSPFYTQAASLSLFHAWSLCKNAYQVDADALKAILAAPLPGKMCAWQMLNRFREYCLYVSFDWKHNSFLKYGEDSATFIKGFFVQLDGELAPDGKKGAVALSCMVVTGPNDDDSDTDFCFWMNISEDGLFGGMDKVLERQLSVDAEEDEFDEDDFWDDEDFPDEDDGEDDDFWDDDDEGDESESDDPLIREQIVKVLAYILADNRDLRLNGAEIDWSDTASVRPRAVKTGNGYKFSPLKGGNVYAVGGKLGDAVRQKLAQGANPDSIKGHFTVEVNPSMNPGDDTLSFALD